MKILIIDSDRDTVSFLKERLREKCSLIDISIQQSDGLRLAKTNDYDVIILAHSLQGKPGCALCNEIRSQLHEKRKHVPVIIISHENDVTHRVRCLNHGADDYILKPFFFEEFLARIQAILRRPNILQKKIITVEDLSLDIKSQKLTRGRKPIYLTRKEYAIIEYLMLHHGMILSRSDIVEHVWDINANPFSNMIEMHILNLRRKIAVRGKPNLIHCIPGRGYKVDAEK